MSLEEPSVRLLWATLGPEQQKYFYRLFYLGFLESGEICGFQTGTPSARLILSTLFCCRPAGPGDQAVQDGGGLLVFGAQGAEGQHGEGSTRHGLQEL